MDSLEIKNFFNLDKFEHSEFIENLKYPWEIITKLDSYINQKFKDENIIVGEGSHIDPSAKIEGKLILGKNSTIADNVLIRENCIVGDNVHIGHAVELKHSLIFSNTAVAHFNYVGDSVIGSNVNIGGGAIIANWRFDKKNILIKTEEKMIDTKLEKFGAVVGDGCSIGVNSVLNPGTILGKGTVVFPLQSAIGVYPSNSIIK